MSRGMELLSTPTLAMLSGDRKYRYFLQRPVEGDGVTTGPRCLFIMLNPSSADEHVDDPTIRRCRAFAAHLGAAWLHVVNLFAYRATDPAELYRLPRNIAIGFENDNYIVSSALVASHIICAWGNHGELYGRGAEVLQMLRQLRTAPAPQALKINKSGHPAHPLYLPANSQLCPI